MIWRLGCFVALLLLVFSSKINAQALPAGFARNPYGVAGSPGALKLLSMPATSEFYDWTPKDNARYITLRPYCPPRNCDGSRPAELANYWFWNAAANVIGHDDEDRIKFRDFVLRNKGAIWIIGNEPDRKSQDNLTPTQYATMFQTYFTVIKQLDPSAKFALGSLGQATYYVRFSDVKPYQDAVFAEYKRLFQVDLPFDYWNLHAYYAGWDTTHARTPDTMVAAVDEQIINPFLEYRSSVDGGKHRSKPILATEIGMSFGKDNALGLSEEVGIALMRAYTRRLLTLVENGTLESFFWFYGGWLTEEYELSSLLQSDWKTPTQLGIAYAQEARAWDRKFGLEQADYNLDKKIGILDFSGLVKVFGTSNALLSLDADPRITRADLTIFKQVFKLANQ